MSATSTGDPSVLLILPFFGPLPSYASLFFRSCAENPSINWLLVTDQPVVGLRLPGNVAVKMTTFPALKQAIDRLLGIETALWSPYKLCDFKPAYGVIFAADVAGFDFWGHCDMDMIFGDIRKFVTADILAAYNKVMIHGHLSLYRNCEESNNYFRLESPGISFRDVFTSTKSRAFDEFGGIRLLLNHHGIQMFRNDNYLADINSHVYRLSTVGTVNHQHQCFSWEEGRLFRDFWDGSGRGRQEYMYIHLQKRRMLAPSSDLGNGSRAWYITPRGFLPKHSEPDGPAEMDRLNPGSVVFGAYGYLNASLARMKWRLGQRLDPWPRRPGRKHAQSLAG